MPWCPKCQNEYKAGISICADCNTALVDVLEPMHAHAPLAGFQEEGYADKLVSFLNSEKLEAVIIQEEEGYLVLVPENVLKRAKKLYQAFYTVELEALLSKQQTEDLGADCTPVDAAEEDGDSTPAAEEGGAAEDEDGAEEAETNEDPEEHLRSLRASSVSYVKKSDRSKELRSTGITFLFFGFFGILFTGLNVLGVFTLFNNALSYIVMGIVFAGCLVIGVLSLKDAKKAGMEAVEEEALTKTLNQWMKQNMTKEVIAGFQSPDKPDEINFFAAIEGIKEAIAAQFGEIDDLYLDSIVEEYYNKEVDSST